MENKDTLILSVQGNLVSNLLADLWNESFSSLEKKQDFSILVVDLKDIQNMDGTGVAFLDHLQRVVREKKQQFKIINLPQTARDLYQRLSAYQSDKDFSQCEEKTRKDSTLVEIGKTAEGILRDCKQLISFSGEVTLKVFLNLLSPGTIRWKDFWTVFNKGGVNALPLVCMIGFLVGVIMAFQSAIPMRQFGADIFVANLVALSMLRELGPLMTAIILAGRSGSAFAAELGTMKVNEEINALKTMGIDSTRFLVISRVLAVCLLTPLLSVFADLAGLFGGGVVMQSLGYPPVTYISQITQSVGVSDFLGGIFKAFVFGVLIAGVGCLRGMQTGKGASAVGDSATRAVVSGIVLIVILDGVFSVLYYFLGV